LSEFKFEFMLAGNNGRGGWSATAMLEVEMVVVAGLTTKSKRQKPKTTKIK
jgi:hypothetical protein